MTEPHRTKLVLNFHELMQLRFLRTVDFLELMRRKSEMRQLFNNLDMPEAGTPASLPGILFIFVFHPCCRAW